MTDPQHEETFADTERKLREIITTLRAQLAEARADTRKVVAAVTNPSGQKCEACRETGAYHCSDPINCGGMIDVTVDEAIALVSTQKARADRAEAALAAQIKVDAEIADRAAHHAMRDGMCYAPDGRSTAYHTVMDQPHDRTALDRYRENALREAADELRGQGYGAAVRTILALIEKPNAG